MHIASKRPRTALCLSMLAMSCLSAATLGKPPKDPPGGGNGETNFAFVFYDKDDGGLFLTTIDDGTRTRLTEPERGWADVSPAWSPDLDLQTPSYQARLAFLRRPTSTMESGLHLYLIDPDGENLQLVRSFHFPEDPVPGDQTGGEDTLAWSPNGSEILFFSFYGTLFAVDVADGSLRELPISGIDRESDPSISAANGLLAFYRDPDVWAVSYSIDADGRVQVDPATQVNLTENSAGWSSYAPAWSPDGQFLAYIHRLPDLTERLVVQEVLTGGEMVIWEEDRPNLWNAGEPHWSPDGLQIGIDLARPVTRTTTIDVYRIADWWDPLLRQLHPVTSTDHYKEREQHSAWLPDWVDE